jgi:drug/metabolite transporter (DMT)-like permease
LFAEIPTIWTWIGGAVIFASTFYIARREAKVARERAAAARSSCAVTG